jgi:hypothetical protein
MPSETVSKINLVDLAGRLEISFFLTNFCFWLVFPDENYEDM